MGNALKFLLGWFLRVAGIFLIVVAWLAYFGMWNYIGSFSLGFIYESLTAAIGLTLGGVFLLLFGSGLMRPW